MAYLITFGGGEGAGKTLQIDMFKNYLIKNKFEVKVAREPGGEEISEQIREIILSPKNKGEINPMCETFLFMASRTQYVNKEVRPFLTKYKENKKAIFISDRFADDSIPYQGYGRGVRIEHILTCNKIATENLIPDLTYVIDVPAEKGLEKLTTDEFKEKDRFESEGLSFHEKVNQGFRELKDMYPIRVKLIPYLENRANEMHNKIITYFEEFIKSKNV